MSNYQYANENNIKIKIDELTIVLQTITPINDHCYG